MVNIRFTERNVKDSLTYLYRAGSSDKSRWRASFAGASLPHGLFRITAPKSYEFNNPGSSQHAWMLRKAYQGAGIEWLQKVSKESLSLIDVAEILNAYMGMPQTDRNSASLTLDQVRGYIIPQYYDLFSGPEWASMAGQEEVD
jgi:hypothetical protein